VPMTTTLVDEAEYLYAPQARRRARVLRAPGLDMLFAGVFALFGFGVGIERLSDNSFFTHLATGRWILDHGIPRVDFYSYTAPGTRWIVQSWLAEALYAQLERWFGAFGIRVLGALTGAAITVLVFRLAAHCARDRIRAALITVAALGGLYTLWSERPLLLGVLFLVVALWVVEVPESLAGRHPYIVLPVLFWLWVNVHGTFALGFAYIALHLVGRWLDGARPWQGRERTLLLATAAAFAVTFVNPYGPSLVFFPVELLGRGDILRHVIEWASPNFHDVRGQSFLLWLAVFVAVLARGRHRLSRRDLVVTVPFLLLALWALRNVAIAPLIGLPVVARAVAIDPDVSLSRRHEERRSPLGWAFAVVLVLVGFALVVRAVGQPDFVTSPFPVKAMRALEQQDLIGRRLLLDDGDAAYAELGYFPEQKVFFDDRYDMYPTEVVYDFFTLSNASPGWRRVLEKYDVETVVWPRTHPLVQFLRTSGDWTVVHRDRTWIAMVRDDVQ
jgi:hypothetical protein